MIPREIGFAYVLVNDVPLTATSARAGQVIECARRSGGDVLSLDCSLILVAFGMSTGEIDGGNQRGRFVDEVNRQVGDGAACVHGRRHALVGSMGTRDRLSFTLLFEGLRECLAELTRTPFGEQRLIEQSLARQ